MATISERLVDLTHGIRFDNLPTEVVQESGRRLLDALGCMIAGARGPTTLQVAHAVTAAADTPESTLIGMNAVISCEKAALVNGTALRFLDFMDGHMGPYPCHPCFNIPPILAVAEKVRATGPALVTAIVTAYEIMPRFQENAGLPDLGARGWAGSSNLAASIPLAIAPLLGLDREQTISAVGISLTHGSVLNATSHGQMPASKSILDGMTAMSSIVATLLARAGVSGPREVIEGKGGYVAALAGTCDFEKLLAPIDRHKISETYNKLYNTVQCGQTAVAAAFDVVQGHQIKNGDIAAIRIGLARRDATSQSRPSCARPESRDTANHSVRYCVAAALVDGELTAAQFEPEKLHSRAILDLVDRTEVYWDESQEAHWPVANPATITIRTTRGEEHKETLVFPPGHFKNPLPDAALEKKFRQLTERVIAAENVEKIIAMTRQIADLDDVHALTNLLRPRQIS